MATPRTNTAWVRFVMDHSPTGALAQAFVVEAIRRYASEVSAYTAEQVATMTESTGGLFNGEQWKATAEHLDAEYVKQYKPRK